MNQRPSRITARMQNQNSTNSPSSASKRRAHSRRAAVCLSSRFFANDNGPATPITDLTQVPAFAAYIARTGAVEQSFWVYAKLPPPTRQQREYAAQKDGCEPDDDDDLDDADGDASDRAYRRSHRPLRVHVSRKGHLTVTGTARDLYPTRDERKAITEAFKTVTVGGAPKTIPATFKQVAEQRDALKADPDDWYPVTTADRKAVLFVQERYYDKDDNKSYRTWSRWRKTYDGIGHDTWECLEPDLPKGLPLYKGKAEYDNGKSKVMLHERPKKSPVLQPTDL